MKTMRMIIAAIGLSLFGQAASAQATKPALIAYLSVKDALVATDGDKAKAKAEELVSAFNKVAASALSATDQKALTAAKASAASISKTSEIEVQREQFETLSKNMIVLAKSTKPGKAYVQFCPMKDASWLSDKKEVANPYYGSKMLKCGKVTDEI
ncbi:MULTISPECIES: DUF3347 domain-containing protein [Larkinella]|uniref:DUF3347 domain-containing protein n=1 Tax=Larkinella punicea TaxID=2315727 RepID=A0A368JHG6_9BACT|nr:MULTISPECIES: DUF3347 domain-containing protein [Larkinella]RCR67110.1 DUF3347 domain-containing protein [Larkinella punicea]